MASVTAANAPSVPDLLACPKCAAAGAMADPEASMSTPSKPAEVACKNGRLSGAMLANQVCSPQNEAGFTTRALPL